MIAKVCYVYYTCISYKICRIIATAVTGISYGMFCDCIQNLFCCEAEYSVWHAAPVTLCRVTLIKVGVEELTGAIMLAQNTILCSTDNIVG